jgi:hypothetical protein
MSAKQEGMIKHYEDTYTATYRYEYQRNRLFVLLILVLVAGTYLAFDKEVAQVGLTLLVSQLATANTDIAQSAIKKVNFYRIFSVISLLATFYLIVNLHHRLATIKRNYKYLGALEGEIRSELGIPPPAVFFTRESTFYHNNRSKFSWFARLSYGVVLIGLVVVFLGVRLSSDWPENWFLNWPSSWPADWFQKWRDITYRQVTYDQMLFVLDVLLGFPIVGALFAYVALSFR